MVAVITSQILRRFLGIIVAREGDFGDRNLVVCGIFAIFANIFDAYDRVSYK